MKKTYKLKLAHKHPDRVLDAIKHDLRKFVKRHRAVPLPEGADYWDFDCRFGPSEAEAEVVHFGALTDLMNETAAAGAEQFFVEITAKPGKRKVRIIQLN